MVKKMHTCKLYKRYYNTIDSVSFYTRLEEYCTSGSASNFRPSFEQRPFLIYKRPPPLEFVHSYINAPDSIQTRSSTDSVTSMTPSC